MMMITCRVTRVQHCINYQLPFTWPKTNDRLFACLYRQPTSSSIDKRMDALPQVYPYYTPRCLITVKHLRSNCVSFTVNNVISTASSLRHLTHIIITYHIISSGFAMATPIRSSEAPYNVGLWLNSRTWQMSAAGARADYVMLSY